MKRLIVIVALLCLSLTLVAAERLDLRLPDLPEYQIIKCDFHTHTVFSDGDVWPTFRVEEAWATGLDALSITDHVEYQKYIKDIPKQLDRSYEVAQPYAQRYMLTLIKGAEITRDMPPGHLNALFVGDIDELDTETWREAIEAANEQGAFVFWNHPGWTGQQPDGISRWYDEHTEILDNGWLHGIEVVNSDEFYPRAFQWCLDHNLTLIGNSDVHGSIARDYATPPADHRPMTWVLATDNSETAIKEALFDRRTVVYWRNWLIGREAHLKTIFDNAVEVSPVVTFANPQGAPIRFTNTSDLEFELESGTVTERFSVPETVHIPAGSSVLIPLRKAAGAEVPESITVEYRVTNLKIAPETSLPVSWEIKLK